jgi:multisubunit Na+/H+ antiporter MnhF subunit
LTAWTAGAIVATLVLAAAGLVMVRGSIGTRLVALQFSTAIASIDVFLTAQSFGNESSFDAALALALLSFPASLIFARYYARWL